LEHGAFRQLGDWLRPGDLLVVNDSRVLPARLRGQRTGGGEAEVLLLREVAPREWEALVRPSRRLRVGDLVTLRSGDVVEIGGRAGEGTRVARFSRDPARVMAEAGETPLPPYIKDRSSLSERYQTVYARPPGSAAAPTAGLHFTPDLLASLLAAGVRLATVTLHVGLDTFRPLEGEFVDEHRIHTEWYEIPAETAQAVAETRAGVGRVVAIGTTSTRVLETAAHRQPAEPGTGASGWTDLYVTPPHRFRAVDALVTNFHLPRSSLLLLVSAFVQSGMEASDAYQARDTLLAAYAEALGAGYRFFSFGDAMLIV
jgi:S-adenosylmethionine:tRNA ribosyltransferase-isomerase